MNMPARQYGSQYRFGYNGQEKDDEVAGVGNSLTFKYRIDDTRLARFFSVDPLVAKYPWNSPYAFAENRVIDGKELEGLEYVHSDEQRVDNVTVQERIATYYKPTLPAQSTTTSHDNTTDANGRVTNSTLSPSAPNAPNPATVNGTDITQTRAGNIVGWANSRGVGVSPGTFNNPVSYNTPLAEPSATTNINLTSQFNQGYVITNITNRAVPPGSVNATTSINNAISGNQVPRLTQTAPGNTSRVLIVTNGSAASVANATATAAALVGGNPQLQVAVLSVPTRINPGFSVVLNPTQDRANRLGWNAPTSIININFTTPMIPRAPIVPLIGNIVTSPDPYPKN